jgi:adenylosuccinate lyase
MNRQAAHELLRKLTIKSDAEKRRFMDILLEDKTVSGKLSNKEIREALDPRNYLGTAAEQVEYAVKKTLAERKTRG